MTIPNCFPCRQFAAHLGMASRTVAKWHEKPGLTPRTEVQQLLDTALERAPEAARTRFATLIAIAGTEPPAGTEPGVGRPPTVAIAVVTRESDVLIVQRRGDDNGEITWQFPAGMIKPGTARETTAVRETLAETGVHCAVVRRLGNRLHPVTNVHCEYLLCDYLTGEAENRDLAETLPSPGRQSTGSPASSRPAESSHQYSKPWRPSSEPTGAAHRRSHHRP